MNLENPTRENLKHILNELADQLDVVNRELMEADDYDLDKYEDIKFMYDMVKQKGSLSPSETQAFITELRAVRKA
ncbi:hypothetical protein GCM10028778_03110 [Barrientosiimonas marina]|uniref:DUF1128 domain-containing protein n=1 Tax=Lentibacillus kimchii TaxID=1542911 RepID=A0ABW2URM7_9BACI